MVEKPRVWVESTPFRWLGGAVMFAVALALLLVWWSSVTPARAAVSTFQFNFVCDGAYCMMPKAGLETLIAANQDLAAKLNAAQRKQAPCPGVRGSRL